MNGEVVHSLGVVAAALCTVACLASLLVARRSEKRTRARGQALLSIARGEPRHGRVDIGGFVRRWSAPLGVVALGCVLIGGLAGGAVGAAGAYGVRRWQRGRDRTGATVAASDAMRDTAHQLPLAADLLAACISAGAGPREAAEAVGESLGGPVGARLARTAAQLRLGAEAAPTWGWFGGIPGAEPLARCLERADSTGAPAAEPVSRLAERFRAERARAVTGRGRRAQVLITAPVGLCFLPAFLAVGVAPVVIGLADGLLRGN
ncbi:type II secretion system F family protein [Streptomyces sp. NPDC006283]|uniref:type II secretion system F family protein n=1 Tax=Streptomyces sp. NPDC006283 TaxID=3156741 RepID=UPI0033BA42C3